MSIRTKKGLGLGLLGLGLFLAACNNTDPNNPTPTANLGAEVTVHNLGDPAQLNPLTSSDASATYIQNNIFSKLLEYDPNTLKLGPQMAVALPEVKLIESGPFAGGMSLTFEILAEATWDNDQPILASDYEFTVKVIKNPRVNAANLRPYFDFIDALEIDPNNPKKFTIFSKDRYMLAESSAGELFVLPEYVYDPAKLMRKFSVAELDDPKNYELMNAEPDIIRFADQFNAPEFDRNTVIGAGPYRFAEWTTKQRIVLERKENWWGDKVKGRSSLQAFPPKIIYEFANWETVASKVKTQGFDVVSSIPPRTFLEFKDNKLVTDNYDLTTPNQFAYTYLGFNTRNRIFADKRVRRAFAHMLNCDEVIETLYEGMAERLIGPINPLKDYYAKQLKLVEYDLEKAKALLEEAGWKDTDGDGILDKVIEGKKTPFRVSYKYNNGNDIRKSIGLILSKEAERLGIKIEIEGKEWAVFLEDTKRRDFDIMCLAWIQGPGNDDLKQIWHTSSDSPDGANRVGFGNNETDRIIDEIRVTLDEAKRKELYLQIQEIIYDEQPYVFICVPKGAVMTHKRFENTQTSALRPGFKDLWFKLKAGAATANPAG